MVLLKHNNAPAAKPSLIAGVATAALGLLMVLFPFLVLFAADHIGLWPLLAALACAAGLRLLLRPVGDGAGAMIAAQACAAALIVGIGLFDADIAARLHPVAVNVAMLTVFAGSLLSGTPIVERLARLTDPDLPPAGIAYCRAVTKVWCGFFVLNGVVALATALWADRATWALYNGFIAYVLIGCLFAVEFVVRQRVKRRPSRYGA